MNIKYIKQLLFLLQKYNVSFFEMNKDSNFIKINFQKFLNKNLYKNNNNTNIKKDKLKTTNCDNKNDYLVRSPMVGVFFINPSTDAPPFIEIGKKINIGDILCIIESMKIVHRIISEKNGIVKKIFLKNGTPVEFDEPMILIE